MPSKLGIHGIMSDQIPSTVHQIAEAGAVMTTVKAVEGIGWLEGIKAISPQTVTVGRYIRGDGDIDVEGPPLDGDLRETAQRVMDSLLHKWAPHREYVDYWEITNELDPPGIEGHRKYAHFFRHCIDIADAEGYKLALFSYSLGVPEWEEWEAIVETGVFSLAKAGGHALSLHEYAYPMDRWFGESLPGHPAYPDRGPLACRYRWLYEDFLKPRDEVIPLFITEANVARDLPLVTQEEWMAQMTWYDARLREDYYVVGAHLFTLGSGGGWANYEFTEWLPALIQHIINLKDAQDPTWPEEDEDVAPTPLPEPTPPPTEPPYKDKVIPTLPPIGVKPPRPPQPGPTPLPPEGAPDDAREAAIQHHYLLLPPDADGEWLTACQRYWEVYAVTIGQQPNEVDFGAKPNLCAVTVVDPQAWEGDMEAFFTQHYPGLRYDPIQAATPDELRRILQWRVTARERFG